MAAHRLSETLGDDQLIASALAFREAGASMVMIATADMGMRIKLRAHQLPELLLPEAYRLPAEPDAVEKEVAALKKQLARHENRQPKLKLTFADGESRLTLKRRPVMPDWIERSMAMIKAKHCPMPRSGEKLEQEPLLSIARRFESFGLPAHTIDRYNTDLESFYDKYQAYLEEEAPRRAQISLTYELKFVLWNEGTAPAKGIDAVAYFP